MPTRPVTPPATQEKPALDAKSAALSAAPSAERAETAVKYLLDRRDPK